MAHNTIVDKMYGDFRAILDQMAPAEISLRVTAEDNFRKNLLLAAASYFEKSVKDIVLQLVSTHASGRDLVVEFVRNKAVERQYHTYFNWDRGNANTFFGLFGEGFKGHMERRVKQEETYDLAIKAFLELGSERNRLVHQDFGSYVLEKTVDEIMDTFHRARPFVDSLQIEFAAYAEQRAAD